MRPIVMIVVLFLPALSRAESTAVRPVDTVAAEALAHARGQSDTVRRLMDTLESSDAIVHIESSWTLPSGIGGMAFLPGPTKAAGDDNTLAVFDRQGSLMSSDGASINPGRLPIVIVLNWFDDVRRRTSQKD